jgi:hypothetical protein
MHVTRIIPTVNRIGISSSWNFAGQRTDSPSCGSAFRRLRIPSADRFVVGASRLFARASYRFGIDCSCDIVHGKTLKYSICDQNLIPSILKLILLVTE